MLQEQEFNDACIELLHSAILNDELSEENDNEATTIFCLLAVRLFLLVFMLQIYLHFGQFSRKHFSKSSSLKALRSRRSISVKSSSTMTSPILFT